MKVGSAKPAPLRLRLATVADGRLLLSWRNDPETRRQSFSRAKVSLGTHLAWLAGKLADRRCRLYLAVDRAGEPVAQVRLEPISRGAAEVHIAVAPEARGRGLARATLGLAAAEARSELRVATLVAHIRPDNVASVIAFVKAGFQFRRLTTVRDTRCYRLERPL
jgi:RimJ/RimL family protein N-acetyltransferase